jgi:hypothetical protein
MEASNGVGERGQGEIRLHVLYSPHIKVRNRDHTKRQATQHDCLPSLLGSGDKGIEIVYGEKKYLVLAD